MQGGKLKQKKTARESKYNSTGLSNEDDILKEGGQIDSGRNNQRL
jgi:hypothetical protein